MARQVRAVGVVLAVLVVGIVGCQRFNFEKTVTLPLGGNHSFFVDPARSEQKVTVAVDAHGTPVNIYVLLEDNKDAVMQKVEADRSPDPALLLASKEKTQSEQLQVTVPSGKSVGVILNGASKQTEVKIKISGS